MTDRLPNLVIAGVAKGGTTSLFHYLAQHHDICASKVKELDHFSALRRPGGDVPPVEEYARHFSHCDGQPYRMEASPAYCYAGAPVIQAMQAVLGRPRVIISLRDPVRRFWSAYTFLQSMGRLPADMTCDDYITACEVQIEEGRHAPLSVGRYVDYLPEWIAGFGEDLRIVFAEHLFADPGEVVGDVLGWLELAPAADDLDYGIRNPTQMPRSRALAYVAYRAKDVSDRVLEQAPRVRAALRSGYRRLNARDDERTLPDGARARLQAYYAEPTAALADVLVAHGVLDHPAWLGGRA